MEKNTAAEAQELATFTAWLAKHDARPFCPGAYTEHACKWNAWKARASHPAPQAAAEDIKALKDEIARLEVIDATFSPPRPTDDELWDKTLSDRDRYHDMADRLAQGISKLLEMDIGEHTSSNCPWTLAAEAVENVAALSFPARDSRATAERPAIPAQGQSELSAADALLLERYGAEAIIRMKNATIKAYKAVVDEQNDVLASLREARAAQEQAASCPDGWKLVPIEPTMEMVDAVANIDDAHTSTWATYLAAAPTPPAAPQPRELTDAEAHELFLQMQAHVEKLADAEDLDELDDNDHPKFSGHCMRFLMRHLSTAPAQKA